MNIDRLLKHLNSERATKLAFLLSHPQQENLSHLIGYIAALDRAILFIGEERRASLKEEISDDPDF